jgi:hypothetical protein
MACPGPSADLLIELDGTDRLDDPTGGVMTGQLAPIDRKFQEALTAFRDCALSCRKDPILLASYRKRIAALADRVDQIRTVLAKVDERESGEPMEPAYRDALDAAITEELSR